MSYHFRLGCRLNRIITLGWCNDLFRRSDLIFLLFRYAEEASTTTETVLQRTTICEIYCCPFIFLKVSCESTLSFILRVCFLTPKVLRISNIKAMDDNDISVASIKRRTSYLRQYHIRGKYSFHHLAVDWLTPLHCNSQATYFVVGIRSWHATLRKTCAHPSLYIYISNMCICL